MCVGEGGVGWGLVGVSAYRNKNYRGKEDMVGNEFNLFSKVGKIVTSHIKLLNNVVVQIVPC